MAVRYIFGCSHPDRRIPGKSVFEKGLELPALYCNECIDFCHICLKITTTRHFEQLHLCNSCFEKVRELKSKFEYCEHDTSAR